MNIIEYLYLLVVFILVFLFKFYNDFVSRGYYDFLRIDGVVEVWRKV